MIPILGFSFMVSTVSAQSVADAQNNAQIVAEAAGVGNTDLVTIISRIVYIFLGFLGVIFLILMLYAGYLWMTAAGDDKQVQKSKDTIRQAVIGLLITASAFAITNFIFGLLNGQSFFGGGSSGNGNYRTKPGGLVLSSGSLGGGIIESHLPMRNATDVPRNTSIIITFKEAIKPESFIEGWTDATSNTAHGLNDTNIKIYPTTVGESAKLTSATARVTFLDDLKTFVIRPVEYLGNPIKKTGYTVELKGGTFGIQKMNGGAAFSGAFTSGYIWPFEVSTVVDLVPPKVVDVVPVQAGLYARNVVIQITFDKAMDPTAVSGKTADGFSNIEILSTSAGGGTPGAVAGSFVISNQYRTVEFTTEEKCGTNSCAQEVFCLPGDSSIQVVAKAATLANADSPQAELTSNGYNGIVSVAGNSLDGSKDGKAEGPPGDNYSWQFGTTGDVKLTPPRIEATIPSSDPQTGLNSNIPLDLPFEVKFDTRLRSSSLNTQTIMLDAHGKDETRVDSFWWTVAMSLLNQDGTTFDPKQPNAVDPPKSGAFIQHRVFLPSGKTFQDLNFYDPYVFHGVQDVYQNCFNPAAKCGSLDYSDMLTQGPNCCNSQATKGECKTLLHP
ncbi:Ig-like domain-containing protein [Candidatus Uhrbacteria bacterium]|nr:Ig-like domain-containing protein [Candidatus Uhrbacteria bacterium]